jgi:hypothetical protein
MADMVHLRTSEPAKNHHVSSDFTFIVLAAVVSIGLIVVAFALTVSPALDPDQVLSIFASP